jgi:acylphosphatase
MSTSTDLTARRVTVHGEVQGVSFRDYCAQEARRLGVLGWVRNEPDGTVTAYLEGGRTAVRELVDWCREGPPSARVFSLDEQTVEPLGATGFSVG